MNVGLYHTVAAMRTNQQRVEIISSNIANSESAGFKRMLHVAHGNSGWGREPSHEQIVTGTRVDLSQGVLERTGESLDLALDGPGFFVLDGPNGEALTRNVAVTVTSIPSLGIIALLSVTVLPSVVYLYTTPSSSSA